MARDSFQITTDLRNPQHTDIIDVRSPSEFSQDHIPAAINLPVLDDDERKEVGTLHKTNAFGARKRGAALISRNIAKHIDGPLNAKDGSFYPLIYCWRGGLRSQSLGLILAQIGFRASVLEGGYRFYRHSVLESLEELGQGMKLRILAGLTGTSKTSVLHRLEKRGLQVLDLEGLANHKGSLLGSPVDDTQPSQKSFESRIVAALSQFDPNREVWVECESNKIGSLHTPKTLFQTMQQAPVVEIRAPIQSRVDYLLRDYRYFCEKPELLKSKVSYLAQYRSKSQIESWNHLIDQQQWSTFVAEILEYHYDPSYSRSKKRWAAKREGLFELDGLGENNLERLADVLADKFPAHPNQPFA